MKHTVQLDTGNYSVIVTGSPKAESTAKYEKLGIVYDLQRGAITKAYLGLVGVPGKREGTLKFPAGFERDKVEFSEASAATMREAVEKQFAATLDDLKVVVVEHTKEESSDGRSHAKAIYARWVAADVVEKKLTALEFDGDMDDVTEVVEWIHAEFIAKP